MKREETCGCMTNCEWIGIPLIISFGFYRYFRDSFWLCKTFHFQLSLLNNYLLPTLSPLKPKLLLVDNFQMLSVKTSTHKKYLRFLIILIYWAVKLKHKSEAENCSFQSAVWTMTFFPFLLHKVLLHPRLHLNLNKQSISRKTANMKIL